VSTFTSTVRTDVEIDLDPELSRAARNRHRKELDRLILLRERHEKDALPARLEAWLRSAKKPSPWSILEPGESKSAGGATFVRQPDGSLLATGKNAPFDTYTFVVRTKTKGITAIRLEALAHPSMVRGGPGRAGNGNFALSDFKVTAAPLAGGK